MIHVLCRDGRTALFDEGESVQTIDPQYEIAELRRAKEVLAIPRFRLDRVRGRGDRWFKVARVRQIDYPQPTQGGNS